MKPYRMSIIGALLLFVATVAARAEVKAVVERNRGDQATPAFKFKNVPAPSNSDAAQKAKFEIVDGEKDDNSGDLDKLHDGAVPTEEDQPAENFFFTQNADGGRILIDLGKAIAIKQINTYSWHPNTRGPQVYTMYGADGEGAAFDPRPKRPADPEKAGWKLIAKVETRPKEGEPGGQYGVSLADADGVIGKYRYLLMDARQTESDDAFGNTFYSEIDVIDKNAEPAKPAAETRRTLDFGDKYHVVIDYTEMPEFDGWVNGKLAPVVEAWYPKIVAMLPSDGYEAPTKFSITFKKDGKVIAYTAGTRIVCAGGWFSKELDKEAVGAIVHEMVHVVQQYGRAQVTHRHAQIPGWLVEGIPDYIRWFLYEPGSHGADHIRKPDEAKYDGSYRVSANFLDFVTRKYDRDLVRKLNAALRDGKYTDDLWTTYTDKPVDALAEDWKAALKAGHGVARVDAPAEARPAAAAEVAAAPDDAAAASANTLSDAERQAGWKLLFDGKSLAGWHSFHKTEVLPGWQVKDGTVACVDPHHAGDLCTNDQFDWFELRLDYNISPAGNSGILYHVTDKGGATWATGPEFQLEDNVLAADKIRCGWLYALYQPPIDPNTGKTLDATKPVGQWNHVRLLVTPGKCEHEINGVKYFEYVLHSDDFNQRVAKSKFRTMPDFCKSDIGYLALQGDHGQVTFRNIKIRPVHSKD